MSEFLKSNSQIDKVVMDATTWEKGKEISFENMREQLKEALAKSGVIQRDAQTLGYGSHLLPGRNAEPVAAAPAAPAPVATCSRVIYPHMNDRYELTGSSELELDQKEAAIRSALGGAR